MKRIFAALLPLLLLCGCAPKEYSADFFAMDTFMSVRVLGKDGESLSLSCEQRINQLEQTLSRTREDSDIWRINHAAGAPVSLSADSSAALQTALSLSEQTDGLFDPTVAPLTDLWGIGTENARVPAQEEIDAALALVGAGQVSCSETAVQLAPDAQLDLGGIAKGYAADACAHLLREDGASGLLVLGGNIYAVGSNDGKDWVIGIADPDDSADFIATAGVQNMSVVTSGDYERYFEQDGHRYHHIFDPRTGYPADAGLRSVTVIDQSSTRADALTTALFVMGLEDGLAFCAENDVAAVFVTADKQVVTTAAVDTVCRFRFEGTEKGYAYAQ